MNGWRLGLWLLVVGVLGLARGGDPLSSARDLYARGEFGGAAKLAASLGSSAGYALAARASSVSAQTLPRSQQDDQYETAERYARQAIAADASNPEGFFELARATGQLGELRGALNAILGGVAGQVRDNLERALRLQPDHSEATLALGAWNAEVVARGGLIAPSLGARREAIEPLFQKALRLDPKRIGYRLTYARALLTLDRGQNRARAVEQLQVALRLRASDAEERLNLEAARAELERLR